MPNFNCDPNADTAGLVDLSYGWEGCTSIESFPPKDFSSGLNFNYTWANCSSMATIAELYLYNQLRDATEFVQTWEGCSSLTSFGALDLSSATVFDRTWKDCSSLTSFPFIFIGSGVTFTETWSGCSSLTSFPSLNFSNGASFEAAWYNCSNLSSFPPNLFTNAEATDFGLAWRGCALTAQSIENILVSIDSNGATGGVLDISLGTNACFGEWTSPAVEAYNSLIGKSWAINYNDCPPPPISPITVELRPEGPSPYALPLTDYTIIEIVMSEGSDPLIAGQYNLFTVTLTPLNGTSSLDYFFPITGTGYDFLDLNYTGANPGAWISPPWGPQGAVIWSPVRIGDGPDYVFVCAAQNISFNTIPAGSTLGKMYVHTPPVCSEGVSTGASWEISISQTTQQELDASYAIGQTLSPGYPSFELRPAVIGTTDLTSGYTVDGERMEPQQVSPSSPPYAEPPCLPPSQAALQKWGLVYAPPGGPCYTTRLYLEVPNTYNNAPYIDFPAAIPAEPYANPITVQPYLVPPFENNGWYVVDTGVPYGPVIQATVTGVELIDVKWGGCTGGAVVWSTTPTPPPAEALITLTASPTDVVNTGATNIVFSFTRTGSTVDPLAVNFNVGGTATFGTDYTQSGAASFSPTSGSILIPAGQTTGQITIDPDPGASVVSSETVEITLVSGSGYTPVTTNPVVGTIYEDILPVAIQQNIYIRSILATIDGNLLTGEVNTPGPNPTLPVVFMSPVVGTGGPSNQIFELISDSVGLYGIFTLDSNGDFEYIVDLTNPIVLDLSPYTTPGVGESFQFRVTDLAGNTSEGIVNVSIQASFTRVAAAFTYDPIPPVPPNQGRKMWHLNAALISTLSNPNYTFFGLNYPWTGVTDPPMYITGYTDYDGNWLIGGPPPSGFFD